MVQLVNYPPTVLVSRMGIPLCPYHLCSPLYWLLAPCSPSGLPCMMSAELLSSSPHHCQADCCQTYTASPDLWLKRQGHGCTCSLSISAWIFHRHLTLSLSNMEFFVSALSTAFSSPAFALVDGSTAYPITPKWELGAPALAFFSLTCYTQSITKSY